MLAYVAFVSPNRGVQRLAVVLAVLGAAIATLVWGRSDFQRLQRREWAHEYFVSYVAHHPELTIKREGGAIYLLDDKPHPEWDWNKSRGEFSWDWVAVKSFSSSVESGVGWYEYYVAIIPGLWAALLIWLLIHTIAWVRSGFVNA